MNSFGLNQDDVFIHITNQNQQRFSPSQESSRWNIEIFLNFLKSQGYNESQVWRNIQSIIVKAILSVHSKLLNASNTYAAYPKNCFQIFGIDIDLDSNLKPWLIESNINPFLEAKVAWERKEKLELLYRMFAMIGITNFNNTSFKSDIQTRYLITI